MVIDAFSKSKEPPAVDSDPPDSSSIMPNAIADRRAVSPYCEVPPRFR